MPILVTAQSYTITTTPTLSYLFNSKNEIGTISNTNKLNLFPLVVGTVPAKFKLIKNNEGLFALVDGTGQVYKATNLNNDEITFTRIDSTRFYGNTFESINFSYKGVIYNFGGYGFWNRNGQLSHFTTGAEWSIDKINKKYTTTNRFYSYLPSEDKLYYIEFPWDAEATFDKISNASVIVFDLKKKENTLLGKFNPKIESSFVYLSIEIASLKGHLRFHDREIYLYRFLTNKIYKLTNSKLKDELLSRAGAELQSAFEDNGRIYYSFINDTTLRSFKISMDDFKEEPYPLYIPLEISNFNWIIFGLPALIIVSIVIFLYINKKKKHLPNLAEKDEIYNTDLSSNEFNTIERSLINKLIEKSNIDSHLTVDELNTILGIKKKTIEIQKRVRTEAINRINHKFNVNYNIETTFIERTRSAEDRRYFNYIINKENSRIYQALHK